jgi:hypothetical protein
MKKTLLFVQLFSIFLLINSCSEEILPSTDGKETAVVFATLNQKDTIHFVKITKAFYGGGNSLEIAKIPDSSYFNKVDATIKEYISGTLTRTFILKDTIVSNKNQNGAFYAPEQKLYYFKTKPSDPLINSFTNNSNSAIYKFEAIINDSELVVKGETSLVGGITISQPTPNSQSNFAFFDVSKNGYANTNISFNTGNAKRIEVKLTVEFEEFSGNNLLYTKSFDWNLATIDADNIKAFTNESVSASGQTFYTLIAQNATKDNAIDKRILKGIRVQINGASNDFQKYLIVNQPSSSLAQNKPSYSNLSVSNGHRVIGIFASRFYESIYKPKVTLFAGVALGCLNNPSMKELCQGQITGTLRFCSDNAADQNQSYFCK